MFRSFPRQKDFLSNFLKILIIVALIGGIFLRFYNLDGKALSNDETFSLTYIYGHSLAGVIDTKILSVEDLRSYQQVNFEEPLNIAVSRLLKNPYVFPPLYGVLMQVWARFLENFTDNLAFIARTLSVVMGILSLLAMYLLCRELEEQSSPFPWISTALIAISPFHLQYSQIVRTYSLITLTTLLASFFLLRAIRLNTKWSWSYYAISLALGLYSNLLFGFVAISHSIYVLIWEKFRLTKILKSYIIAAFMGGLAFIPWFILFITKPGLLGYSVAQVLQKTTFLSLATSWIKNIRPIFIDVNNPWVNFTAFFAKFQRFSALIILIIVLISFYYLARFGNRRIKIFLFCLITFCGLLLMLKDLIQGGRFSVRLRYMIPYVLSIELAVSYFLARQLKSKLFLRKQLAKVTLCFLILGGLLSCNLITFANSWWAFGAPDYPLIASKINQISNSVTIFEDLGDALTMSYLLNPQNSVHLTRKVPEFLELEDNNFYQKFDNIILFKPNKKTLNKIKEDSNLNLESLLVSNPNLPSQPNAWLIRN